MTTSARHVVLMGVAGSGKSTAAAMLRERTGWAFAEADRFHSPANIEKMAGGVPLTDEDRRPWLAALTAWLRDEDAHGRSTIMTCSALKRDYRDEFRAGGLDVVFVHLDGSAELLASRVNAREGHFMPAALLMSQLHTLEPLQPDEPGFVVDVAGTPEEITDEIARGIGIA